MAGTIFISELVDVGYNSRNGLNNVLVEVMPPNTIQTLAFSTTSAASAAFAQGTQIIAVTTDTSSVSISFGTAPVASSATSIRMAAGSTRYFYVPVNASYKVAAIN